MKFEEAPVNLVLPSCKKRLQRALIHDDVVLSSDGSVLDVSIQRRTGFRRMLRCVFVCSVGIIQPLLNLHMEDLESNLQSGLSELMWMLVVDHAHSSCSMTLSRTFNIPISPPSCICYVACSSFSCCSMFLKSNRTYVFPLYKMYSHDDRHDFCITLDQTCSLFCIETCIVCVVCALQESSWEALILCMLSAYVRYEGMLFMQACSLLMAGMKACSLCLICRHALCL